MAIPKKKDALDGLRQFLAALESPDTCYRKNKMDLKPEAIRALKREISALEKVIRRAEDGDA